MTAHTVILASGSPRRTQLLSEAGIPHKVFVADVDENLTAEEAAKPVEACKTLAQRKAEAAARRYMDEFCPAEPLLFIGSDTMVIEGNQIFGKPEDLEDARRMLRQLSGVTHHVVTSVCLLEVQPSFTGQASFTPRTFADTSYVTFHTLSEEDIEEYLACGESADKAGAYAIQGEGKRLVAKFEGDWDTIVGLPVKRLIREFPELLK